MENKFKNYVSIYIRAQSAESGPPLGTILGNLGVNAVKFCKEFNEFTKDFPNFLLLTVHIYIFNDKTFSFNVFEPSLNCVLSLLIREDEENKLFYIMYDDLVKLAKFKFPDLPINKSISLIFSVVKSRGLKVYDAI